MKCLAIGILLTVLAAPVHASLTLSVTQESEVDGKNGFIVESDESGFVREQFLIEENGMIKVYASRDPGGEWQVLPGDPALVPSSTITAGMTWRFPDSSKGERQAEAIGVVNVTTRAGSFSAWRVDVTEVVDTGNDLTIYWADGIGWVSDETRFDGDLVHSFDLDSYAVSGTGYFPLSVGNTWSYVNTVVTNAQQSFSAVKSRFAD